MRAAATAAALATFVASVGVASYLLTDDDTAPPDSTLPATTTTSAISRAEAVEAIARSLRAGLEVALTTTEARCVADALLEIVGPDELEEMSSRAEPLPALDERQQGELVRSIVTCVPSATAEQLLGGSTTSTTPTELPGEGP